MILGVYVWEFGLAHLEPNEAQSVNAKRNDKVNVCVLIVLMRCGVVWCGGFSILGCICWWFQGLTCRELSDSV